MIDNVHSSATIEAGVDVPKSTLVWHRAHIRTGATIGENCVLGLGVYIGTGVTIGDNCKIQNYALIYEPAEIGTGVFIGPSVTLTNDKLPRAVNPIGGPKDNTDWQPVGVVIGEGASIGANSTCVAPLNIGCWAMVGAGSVVTKDVPDFALVLGNPATQVGWVGRDGNRLDKVSESEYVCLQSNKKYALKNGLLHEIN